MLRLPENLHLLVARKFKAAKKSKSLIFSETELTVIKNGQNVPFQLRYLPALAKKPGKPLIQSDDKPKLDPFENPQAELLIASVPQIGPSHILVLNKYPVIENHFILATKISKPQTNILEPNDLSTAYGCLQEWAKDAPKDQARRLFAFFNSGEHSGASQAHRHIQFLPFEDMKGGPDSEWELLIDRMTTKVPSRLHLRQDPGLPFLHYATDLSKDISEQDLYSRYTLLLRAAVCGLKRDGPDVNLNEKEPIEQNSQTVISYNLAITTETMAILPRRSETAKVPSSGQSMGSVAINGTILGGTLMVTEKYEYRALRDKPSLLNDMLVTIGYPASENGVLEQTRL